MRGPLHGQQSPRHPARSQLGREACRPRKRSHLVRRAVQQKGRGAVVAGAEARQGVDGGDEGRWRRGEETLPKRVRGEGALWFWGQPVEEQGQADAFLEEGQDQLGAGVAGPDPAEVGGVAFG